MVNYQFPSIDEIKGLGAWDPTAEAGGTIKPGDQVEGEVETQGYRQQGLRDCISLAWEPREASPGK